MTAPLPIPDGIQLVPGSIVGNKYRIDGCLGEGGMGVVLSATHMELDAPVAIKIVREEFAHSEEMSERVLFEARAIARLRSNHVVRVLDVARLDSGCPYIVMEQLQGADLAQALWEKGALPVAQAIDYLLQACDGLAEAHSLGIVHRDLKPGNLFLATTPEGVVLKVLDFGISKEVNTPLRPGVRISRTSLTSAGDPVGSPYYMAPEQMRASPDIDARADIWSLGAILFELLTGQCPFEGDTITEVCGKVLVEAPPSLSAFSTCTATEFDAVIARCLQKDPNLRYQTVGEFAQALRAWRPSEDVELPKPEAEVKPRPRRSAGLPLATVGLSALLVLGGVGLWQRRTSAASLDAQRVRPVIAAAAMPIWRALPLPPKVEPGPTAAVEARLQSPRVAYPSSFQPAILKSSPPVTHADSVTELQSPTVYPTLVPPKDPAVSAKDTLDQDSAPPTSADDDDSATSDQAVSPPDPVTGRYGL